MKFCKIIYYVINTWHFKNLDKHEVWAKQWKIQQIIHKKCMGNWYSNQWLETLLVQQQLLWSSEKVPPLKLPICFYKYVKLRHERALMVIRFMYNKDNIQHVKTQLMIYIFINSINPKQAEKMWEILHVPKETRHLNRSKTHSNLRPIRIYPCRRLKKKILICLLSRL